MAGEIARKEKDVAIGLVRTGRNTVYANDSKVATEGDLIGTHVTHTSSVIVGFCPNVWAENRRVARKGDATSCGHPISTGSNDVRAGT